MQKKQPKTKEQIVDNMKAVAEAKRLRVFVKDKFFPALINSTESVDDAKFLLGSLSNMVMQEFLSKMKGMKFIELKLHEKLDKKSEKYQDFIDLLALFSNEDVFTCKEIIEGMKGEINMMVDNELKGRKLDTLKTDWLPE